MKNLYIERRNQNVDQLALFPAGNLETPIIVISAVDSSICILGNCKSTS